MDIYGEGDYFPVLVHNGDNTDEYFIESFLIKRYDKSINAFYIDSAFGKDQDILNEKQSKDKYYVGGTNHLAIKLNVKKGNLFAWPDKRSEILYSFEKGYNLYVKSCYKNWIQVEIWNEKTKNRQLGWIQNKISYTECIDDYGDLIVRYITN